MKAKAMFVGIYNKAKDLVNITQNWGNSIFSEREEKLIYVHIHVQIIGDSFRMSKLVKSK